MATKIKDQEELRAWDMYFAAAVDRAFAATSGSSTTDHINNAAKRAADIADRMLAERKARSA